MLLVCCFHSGTRTLVNKTHIHMETNNKLVTSLDQPAARLFHFSVPTCGANTNRKKPFPLVLRTAWSESNVPAHPEVVEVRALCTTLELFHSYHGKLCVHRPYFLHRCVYTNNLGKAGMRVCIRAIYCIILQLWGIHFLFHLSIASHKFFGQEIRNTLERSLMYCMVNRETDSHSPSIYT